MTIPRQLVGRASISTTSPRAPVAMSLLAGALLVGALLSCAEGGGGESDTTPTSPSVGASPLPLPTALETYYVSSSVGNDAYSGRLADPDPGGTDGPKASIQAAIDLLDGAAPGTHVLLRSGDRWTPVAELWIDAAVGTPAAPIVLGAYGTGAQPVIEAQHQANVLLIRGNRSDATSHFWLRDLHVTVQNPVPAQVGIYVGESLHPNMPHDITFSQLTVSGNAAGIILYGDRHLIHGSRVADNTLASGVFVAGNDVTLQYNEFENNGLPPPDVFSHSVYFAGCDGVRFEHNLVHSASDGVKVRATDNGIFRYNTFRDITAIGLHLGGDSTTGAVNNRIESNLFERSSSGIVIKSESGVQVDTTDQLVIANNILANGQGDFSGVNAHIAVADVPLRNVAVVNNLVYEHGRYDGIRIEGSGDNVFCDNNVVGQFGSGGTYALHPAVDESNNLAYTTSADFDSLDLVDPTRLEFETTEESEALIDQGTDVSAVLTTDFRGRPRPQGIAFDIGPFEYAP